MSGNEEFVQEFLVECHENLDQLDQDLVALEADPRDPQRLASIFRTIHTIKGTSGFFGFAKLGALAHAGENLLGRLRDGQLLLNADITTALLELVDAIRQILAEIARGGTEGAGAYGALTSRLAVVAESAPTPTAAPPAPSRVADHPTPPPAPPRRDVPISPVPQIANAPPPVEEREQLPTAAVATAPDIADEAKPVEPAAVESPATAVETTVRVDVELLNQLMNQVGELVLVRNQIRPFAETIAQRVFVQATQQLDHITTELQEGIMKTRMQPIGGLWSRMPRVVRDLGRAGNKQVQLEMHGAATELDRTLLEAVRDPLTHLVRNAVDHGIEAPATRRERGKPEMGQVVLRAYHEGGLVNVEISDDGAGIDPKRVRDKALRMGLVSQERALAMTDNQLMQLIFCPGLSTAERITDVSGRGVGMDVVKTNIERIGGSVEIESRPGQGTTVRVKIPLTLAIIPALMTEADGQRYAIPQVSVREIVSLQHPGSRAAVEAIGSARVYRLRGELLPLVSLHEVLHLPESAAGDPPLGTMVVLQAVGQRFGLIVDRVKNTQEIVVKPLHQTLAKLSVYSGATILGDGRVALILDVAGLARLSGITQRGRDARDEGPSVEQEEIEEDEAPSQAEVLVCQISADRHVAVPLPDVMRIEEVPVVDIQASTGQSVTKYRGGIMPLVSLKRGGSVAAGETGQVLVVVHAIGRRHVGLCVDKIVDIASVTDDIDTSVQQREVRGRTLVHGQVVDVVDMRELARSVGITSPVETAGGAR
jgi:two-component system, chemotaxis family, sensor kinase CheA